LQKKRRSASKISEYWTTEVLEASAVGGSPKIGPSLANVVTKFTTSAGMGKNTAETKVSAMGLDAGMKTGFVKKSLDTELLLFASRS
jgi:hypothetical protein